MFMLAIRDRKAVFLVFLLVIFWLFTLFAILNTPSLLSLIFLIFSIFVTFYFANIFWLIRENLVFFNQAARESVFPSSSRSERLLLLANAFFSIVIFIPNALLLVVKPLVISSTSGWIAVSVLFIFGYFWFTGLALIFIMKLKRGV